MSTVPLVNKVTTWGLEERILKTATNHTRTHPTPIDNPPREGRGMEKLVECGGSQTLDHIKSFEKHLKERRESDQHRIASFYSIGHLKRKSTSSYK